MKKIITAIILLSLSLFLFSCDDSTTSNDNLNDNTSENNNKDNNITTPEKKKYTIKWISNGVVIETDSVEEGSIPTYDGITPTKTRDQEFSYTFTGWDKEIKAANEDTEYNATFTKIINQYTITFYSNGGSTLDSITKDYNSQINEPEIPKKEGHRFLGWCTDSTLENEVTWPITLKEDTQLYACWAEKVDIAKYLKALLESYKLDPMSKIPAEMLPGNTTTLVTSKEQYDYSNSINISNIKFGGHGEQWNMIVNNLLQSQAFYKILNVVDTISSTSIVSFNNYLDSNPSDTANHTFVDGIYNVTIKFENNVLDYILEYTNDLPIFGYQTIQIALTYNISDLTKECRVQIGDSNTYKYTIDDKKYTFAIKYLGARTAYFTIEEDNNGNISGTISEYLGVDSVQTHSSADFYINDQYVTCTGNKASGMTGFTGTICELYDVTTGKMISYEVNETLSLLTYDTLWFNLCDTTGINSIKALDIENGNNPNEIYINGSSDLFKTKNVSIINPSRKFDIELRSQFFYYLNDDEYEVVELKIPMLFIQEDNLSTLEEDIEDENSISFSLNVLEDNINYQIKAYDELITIFNENKEVYTIEEITSFIGNKK